MRWNNPAHGAQRLVSDVLLVAAGAARRFRRLLPARKLNPSRIVVRQFRRDDLEKLFMPIEFALAEQWLAQQERGEVYIVVAEVDGTPVGRRGLDLARCAKIGAVYGFAASVRSQWRSRGVGAAMDAHSKSIARAKGFRAIRCSVDKNNPRSRIWHERLGYQIIGEEVQHWVEADGREVTADCWEFERALIP